ncbi:MAG TPA: hypothetical protein VFK69_02060 [Candidatus Eisenbacteria bacterium]|nr:hypothetical protein [Candidatus Eisenbacteria bacterium]
MDTVEPTVSILGDPDGANAEANGHRVTWTRCNYGGRRAWLVCPHCGRRCVDLYGDVCWCRRCLSIGYWSQLRANWIERRRWKAEGIRVRLGGAPDLSHGFPLRPRGMHRSAYAELRRQGLALEKIVSDVEWVRFELECIRGLRGIFPERRMIRGWLGQIRATAMSAARGEI